jgi:hypothetical protein
MASNQQTVTIDFEGQDCLPRQKGVWLHRKVLSHKSLKAGESSYDQENAKLAEPCKKIVGILTGSKIE